MGVITSATILGKSRSDGTTDRTITMVRVGSVTNGFVLRESVATAPNQLLAQSLTHRSFEAAQKGGIVFRHSQTVWTWPFEAVPGDGIVAGQVTLNRTGLHIPSNCPANVRADIRAQMSVMATGSAGTVGLALVYDPMINGNYAF